MVRHVGGTDEVSLDEGRYEYQKTVDFMGACCTCGLEPTTIYGTGHK